MYSIAYTCVCVCVCTCVRTMCVYVCHCVHMCVCHCAYVCAKIFFCARSCINILNASNETRSQQYYSHVHVADSLSDLSFLISAHLQLVYRIYSPGLAKIPYMYKLSMKVFPPCTLCADSNPPMRLSCGHAISKDAMKKLVSHTRR